MPSALPIAMALTLLAPLACAATARAAAPAPALAINQVSQPTNISPTAGGSISLIVTNDGGASTTAPINVTDTVSPNLEITSVRAHKVPQPEEEEEGEAEVTCTETTTTVSCGYEGTLAGENTQGLSIVIGVEAVDHAPGSATNEAVASSEGASEASGPPSPYAISAATPSFGLGDFHFNLLDAAGAPDTQAGDHPNAVSVALDFNTMAGPAGIEQILAVEPPKSLSLELPVGLIGNPRSAPTCRQYELSKPPVCPAGTVIGTVAYRGESPGGELSSLEPHAEVTPLYNMQAEQGYPAEFAFQYLGHTAEIYTSVVHRGTQYQMRMSVPAINPVATPTGLQLTFFGDPAAVDGDGESTTPLFTTPYDCSAAALSATAATTSWTALPGTPPPPSMQAGVGQPSGCASLQFAPRVQVQPETPQVDSPTGVTVHVTMPQNESGRGLSTPPLQDATVMFPLGMSLSLPAGSGLKGCPSYGPEGIDLYAEQPGSDGEATPVAGHCPRASQIGSATIQTPLLSAPLEGRIYLASPACEPCDEAQVEEGELVKVWVEAEGSGILLQLPGTVEVGGMGARSKFGDPAQHLAPLAPGQMRLQLPSNPQLPTSEVKLLLNGGPQALVENPTECGLATSTSEIVPWGEPALLASPASSFIASWDASGGACPAPHPFSPSFVAGTSQALAGVSSPFTMTLARHDREQPLSTVSMRTPPGFAAEMAGVPRCGEPQAALGACPADSAVGHVHVALGPGAQPLWVEGLVYLTGPYAGAPFGLSLVIPAKAGPFDLGDVVARASIAVDPRTAALTIATAPLPSSAAGVPLRIQTISMTLDRPGFTLNPTDCAQQQITATVASSAGARSAQATPFAAGACANLPFKAILSAHSEAKTSRNGGATLHLELYSGAGQANVAKLHVVLPKQLPTRLSALQQACPARVYRVNPASCPAGSVIGRAIVHTPTLSSPLTGPAYFVAHGGVAFPDIELLLQGEGVTVELEGRTTIDHGITTATFEALPDMRMQSLSLILPAGPHSMLGADGSLCSAPLSLSTILVAQSGAQWSGATHLAVAGCPSPGRAKAARASSRLRRRARRARTRWLARRR